MGWLAVARLNEGSRALKKSVLVGGALAVLVVAGIGFAVWRRGSSPPVETLAPPRSAGIIPEPPANCLLPGPPPVPPNGAVASGDDMKLGHDVMQAFVVQLEDYQACRNSQIDHAAATVTPAQKAQWLEQGNDAVDEANALAAAFGQQLKIFKARNGGE
jgi:hypothetical protein